jgi:myo-inositol-1(or 4)-monophosphatase
MIPNRDDLAGFSRVALAAALEGGACALRHFGKLSAAQLGFKGKRDLLTVADLEVEDCITRALRAAFPGHHVLAEEEVSAARDKTRLGAGARHSERAESVKNDLEPLRELLAKQRHCWLVDPIDGTTNFAHAHPFFAISVALWIDGAPAVAVVHAPALRETFCATAGGGATVNGVALAVSESTDLADALFATGFPYRRNQLTARENNIEHWNRFIQDVRDVRRCGSAAIDLAFVASGRYAFYFEQQLEPWDVAAGALLVTEAGGAVTDYAGGANWLFGRDILASNGALHEIVRSRLEHSCD